MVFTLLHYIVLIRVNVSINRMVVIVLILILGFQINARFLRASLPILGQCASPALVILVPVVGPVSASFRVITPTVAA